MSIEPSNLDNDRVELLFLSVHDWHQFVGGRSLRASSQQRVRVHATIWISDTDGSLCNYGTHAACAADACVRPIND